MSYAFFSPVAAGSGTVAACGRVVGVGGIADEPDGASRLSGERIRPRIDTFLENPRGLDRHVFPAPSDQVSYASTAPKAEKESTVPVAADYPFLDFFWSMLLIFLWIAWIFILFRIIIDVFRRDESGLKKTAWVIFLIFIPFLGVLVYLIVNGSGMTRRDMDQAQAAQADMDAYIRQTAGGGGGGGGGASAEIAKAKELLDSGAISQAEFDQIKQKALA